MVAWAGVGAVVFAELLPTKLGRGKSSDRAFGLLFDQSKIAGIKLTTAPVTGALTVGNMP